MSRRLLPSLAFSVGALLLTLTGCQPGSYRSSQTPGLEAGPREPLAEIAWLAEPRDWEGPSTAVIESQEVVPIVATPPTPRLPVTVTSDDRGGSRDVTVSSAERILAIDLSGSLAQTVWGLGLGDRLVGRDISTTIPGTENLPVVTGSGHALSPESVLELRPDIVLTDGTVGPIDVIVQLRDAGITVVFITEPPGLDQPARQALRVGKALGVPELGQRLAERVSADIDAVVNTIREHTPGDPQLKLRMVFLYLRGASGIYYLFGDESGSGELVEALGGIDVAGEIGWEGLRPVTDEALIEANPDLILVMTGGLESVGGVDTLLEQKPALALTRAGEQRRFVDMADSEVLGFGPRTPLILDALARAIYAPEAS